MCFYLDDLVLTPDDRMALVVARHGEHGELVECEYTNARSKDDRFTLPAHMLRKFLRGRPKPEPMRQEISL